MPTIHDVARKAKVSIAAVSLVINDPNTPRVGAAKRQIILDIAAEMGYTASSIAKALNQGETKILGLLVPMRDPIFFNHFIAQVLSGIQAAILRQGYHLMIYSHHAETGQITAGELQQSRFADGLIVLNTRMCTEEDQKNTIDHLNAARIPFVMANGYAGKDSINYVGLDDYGTGVLAGDFLVDRGHKKIAMISGSKDSPFSQKLLHGFTIALRKKLKFNSKLHLYGNYDAKRIRAEVTSWLESKDRPTAIFCADDQFVPDVYSVIHRLKLSIPKDIAVLGRGNMSLGTAVMPQLTTIDVPGFQIGKEAAELLIQMLRNRPAKSKPKKIILPCTLLQRASV
jgi:DNA-binding LacI/PurR family transcriptional regulator